MEVSNSGFIISFHWLSLLFLFIFNVIIGAVATGMARSRGLREIPAFFAGLFGSFVTLFIIAMFPKRQ